MNEHHVAAVLPRRTSSCLAAAMLLAWHAIAAAAPINHGDFSDIPPGSVMYTDVTESANSPGDIEPLFGTPTIAGDTLSWSSPSFAATAASGRIDPTSATLEFDLAASSSAIASVGARATGLLTLLGQGTTATNVSWQTAISISVLEVDNVALSVPVLLPTSDALNGESLVNGPFIDAPWALSLSYDLDAALDLTGVAHVLGATRISVRVDHVLEAGSEVSTEAMIGTTHFEVSASTFDVDVDASEPASMVLAGLALLAVAALRRRHA